MVNKASSWLNLQDGLIKESQEYLEESTSSNILRTIEQILKYTKEEDGEKKAAELFNVLTQLSAEYMDMEKFSGKGTTLRDLQMKVALGDKKAEKELLRLMTKMILDGCINGLKARGVTLKKVKSRDEVEQEGKKLIDALMPK